VSISRITKASYWLLFREDTCQIKCNKTNELISTIPVSKNGLYKIDHVHVAIAQQERVGIVTLHKCLAHIAPDTIRKMVKSSALEGVQLADDRLGFTCDTCEQAKAMCKNM
jgi:uncharacterized protein YqfB (UPF0267 family)